MDLISAALQRLSAPAPSNTTTTENGALSNTTTTENGALSNTTTTENGALAFESTGSPCLNLFFKLVRGTPQASIETLVYAAWLEDPRQTMQVLLHCRDCRKGKGERQIVHYALAWLRKHKTRTYLNNLATFLGAGYYQDLLSMVKYAEQGGQPLLGQSDMIELEVFAEQLRLDQASASASASTSLAAKWAPTECHADDRKYEMARRLATLLYPHTNRMEPNQHLKQYRHLLSRLRAHLQVVERQMAQGQWSDIQYETVPAKSHRLHKAAFAKHDPERYAEYVQAVLANKKSIKSTGVQPHELVKPFMAATDGLPDQADTVHCAVHCAVHYAVQAQWNDMVQQLRTTTRLSSVLPLCDVSSSMNGEPMEVCIALGLLIAELVEGPFRNMVMTFESNPTLFKLAGDTLATRVQELRKAPWGGTTDLGAAFDQILSHAVQMSCTQDQLPKVLVIFSDMQFNQACPKNHATTFALARDKFAAEGYTLPGVVFWNLRDTQASFPVTMNEQGVALLSGYSASLVKELMADPENLSPTRMLHHVLEPYAGMVTVDDADVGPISTGAVYPSCTYAHKHPASRQNRRGTGPGSVRRKPKRAEPLR